MRASETVTGADVPRGIGLPGWTVVTWMVAGGVVLGGFMVAAMTLAGRLSGNALLHTSAALFLVGAFAGLVHGGVLGWFGRPRTMGRREAAYRMGFGALYAIPALAVGWVVSGWIAMTVVAQYTGKVAALAGVAVSWAVGVVLVILAVVVGARALRNAYARWPGRRMGTALVAGTFAALLVTFLAEQPELWGVRLNLTGRGAVVMAALLTLWVAGPIITAALAWAGRNPVLAAPVEPQRGRRAAATLGIGAAVGLLLALLALPFVPAAYGAPAAHTGAAAAVIGAIAGALVDEVLLRLFLVTGVAWLAIRELRIDARQAAVLAVGSTAVIQLALYVPGALAVGFPSLFAATAYLGAVVLVPAVAFGVLYWARGLGGALVADATAMAAVAVMAI